MNNNTTDLFDSREETLHKAEPSTGETDTSSSNSVLQIQQERIETAMATILGARVYTIFRLME